MRTAFDRPRRRGTCLWRARLAALVAKSSCAPAAWTESGLEAGPVRTPRRSTFRLSGIVAVAALVYVSPIFAGTCLQDEYNAATGKSTKLTCTANDVRIASAGNPRDLNGNKLDHCNAGETFSFIADFTVATTATARENIGLYFATAGQASALTGQCGDNIISPRHSLNDRCTAAGAPNACCTGPHTGTCPTLGSNNYEEFDDGGICLSNCSPDNCGDSSSSDPNGGLQVITVEVDNVLCQAGATGKLSLPDCTSWQQPGGTIQCASAPPDFPFPFDSANKPEAIPGSTSKCHCDAGVDVGIAVQTPGLTVTKTPNPSSFADAGGPVTYTVGATNSSNFGSVTVNQICDDQYGNIATALTNPAQPACPAGKLCAAPNNVAGSTCASNISCSLPQTIAKGSSISPCAFTGNVPETGLTDKVVVNGVGQGGGAISGSASASVTVGEAPSTASTITTSALAIPTSGCATVRYNVQVQNSSGSSTDETETLSGLFDNSVDITRLSANILGTTCGVASGLGTLAGTAGAGAFPTALAVSGAASTYTCQFDAKVCGNTGVLTNPPNATDCPAGLEVNDSITATLTGDESEMVTQTPGNLTVDVCFSTTEKTK